MSSDHSLLTSNRYTQEEKRIYFVGLVSTLFLESKEFKKNEEIRDYLRVVFPALHYKDTVYNSKVKVMSYVIRDIITKYTGEEIYQCISLHFAYLEKKEGKKKQRQVQKSTLLQAMLSSKGRI